MSCNDVYAGNAEHVLDDLYAGNAGTGMSWLYEGGMEERMQGNELPPD